jgi:hypothetical protein
MKALAIAALGSLLLVLSIRAAEPAATVLSLHVFHHENVLGTSLSLKIAPESRLVISFHSATNRRPVLQPVDQRWRG